MKILKLIFSLFVFAGLCVLFFRYGNLIINSILIFSLVTLAIQVTFKKYNNY